MDYSQGEFAQTLDNLTHVYVETAEEVSRPAIAQDYNRINRYPGEAPHNVHHGIVVRANNGNQYLLHCHLGQVIVTRNILNNWTKSSDLSVRVKRSIVELLYKLSGDSKEQRHECDECTRCIKTSSRIAEMLAH